MVTVLVTDCCMGIGLVWADSADCDGYRCFGSNACAVTEHVVTVDVASALWAVAADGVGGFVAPAAEDGVVA